MTRVKRGVVVKKRHKRILKQTKGFWGQRKNVFRRAKETLLRAMAFAFKGRKLKKRDMRGLFITRIKAATTARGLSYNKFMHKLKVANIQLNRKMLSQLAIFEPEVFDKLVDITRS
ncbi:50S ribosomal protein L20 [Vermiphilus pyriformis]|jgi:large subunit ribosomal protein L20|uniref:Large ribosomal subunit protein bL20 n=1 Tax=candidate division TM6 bacterium JCVI TM6SC1 TaxID=1306947 RepID=A0A0D2JKW7_9BACT|nr:50S ribosomal protein L20 [candidate division TM6 bacterium JCVI TM6SC1]UNE35553.1 MAG: 50S ribosomal protein L20 [Vermiphilus pyriformis]